MVYQRGMRSPLAPAARFARRLTGRMVAASCIILMALLLGCSALPGTGPQASTSVPLQLRELVDGDRAVHLALDPVDSGTNHVAVWLTDSQNQVLTTVSSVEMRWSMLDQPTALPATQPVRQANGYWTLAQLPLDSPGWWKADLRFDVPNASPANAQFFLLIPDPTQVSPPPGHTTDPQALAVFQAALARFKQLRSMQADEKLTDGLGDAVDTRFTYAAPDKSAYTTSSGSSSVIIGSDEYDRNSDGVWALNPRTNPFAFPADFPTYYTKAVEQTLGNEEMLDGENCQIITFRIPGSRLWYAWWVGTESHLLRREAMVASHHYMVTDFSGFDQPVRITAPDMATASPGPVANP